MLNRLIKLLGGYTKTEYYSKANKLNNVDLQIRHVVWVIASQQEKLEGALLTLYRLLDYDTEECYRLAKLQSKDIIERTNRT